MANRIQKSVKERLGMANRIRKSVKKRLVEDSESDLEVNQKEKSYPKFS